MPWNNWGVEGIKQNKQTKKTKKTKCKLSWSIGRILILANFVVTVGERININGELHIQVVKTVSTSIFSCKTNIS